MRIVSVSNLAVACLLASGCARTVAPVAEDQPVRSPISLAETIAFHEERVRNDPTGAIGWAMLGESYMEAARQGDDVQLAEKAEMAALRSLGIRRKRNDRAALLLANAHLQHHEFVEALEAVRLALSIQVSPMAQRLRAEVLMELGRYKEAGGAIAQIRGRLADPSALVTLARWEELKGNSEKSIEHLREAVRLVDAAASVSGSIRAYFHNRLGEALWRGRQDSEARAEWDEALHHDPKDYKTLANLTRLSAANKDWTAVLDYGAKTAEVANMTDIEGLVALALEKTGRKREATQKLEEIDLANGLQDHLHQLDHGHSHGPADHGHTHDRLYAKLLADQGRHLTVALHLAKEDVSRRPDVYAWDTYAWVLYRSGRKDEAKVAMTKALALGTEDRQLQEHASVIGL